MKNARSKMQNKWEVDWSAKEKKSAKAKKGLTLIEMAISFLILFIITLSIGELFIAGLSYFKRIRFTSTASFLTSGISEKLLNIPDDLLPGSFILEPPFNEYQASITKTDYDGQFNLITVNVTGPLGTKIKYSFLKWAASEFLGIAADFWGSVISSVDSSQKDVKRFDADGSFNEITSPDIPPLPGSGGKPSGIAQDTSGNILWVGDRVNKHIYSVDVTDSTPSWNPAIVNPSLGIPTGIATDAYSSIVWVGDATNKCIISYDADNNSWGSRFYLPLNGEPAGVATDVNGNYVYVSDISNRKVQIYDNVNSNWKSPLFPGSGFNGVPRGIAVTNYGDWLWVADFENLWRFNNSNDSWTSIPLPSDIKNPNIVLGLAADSSGDFVWLKAKDNSIWEYDVNNNGFTRKWP